MNIPQANINLSISSNNNHIKLGFLCKSIIIIMIIFYFLSFLNKNFLLIYSNIPLFTIYWFEIYRLLIGPFLSQNIYNLTLNIVTLLTIVNYYENTKGTLKFTIMFLSHLILFQLIAILFNLALTNFFPIMKFYVIQSITPLGLALMIQHIILSDFKHLNLLKNSDVNNRFLFILTLFFLVLFNNEKFGVEILLSIFYGLFLCKYNELFLVSDERLLFIEKHENYKIISNLEGNLDNNS